MWPALAAWAIGCGSVDGTAQTDALYQHGALPVAPWTAANPDDNTAGDGEDEPSDDGAAGAGGGGVMNAAGTGGISLGGGGGMGGAGGMPGNVIKPPGSGGMTGSGGTTGKLPGITPTHVTLDFTTKPQGGRYQPRNIGVVWIQNASGDYVTTIEVWANRRAIYLRKWLSVNPFGDSADAVSSATLLQHKTHKAVWDLKDDNGTVVPDGEYTLFVELTDKDAAGVPMSVSFTKSPEAQTMMVPDAQYYTGVTLTYE